MAKFTILQLRKDCPNYDKKLFTSLSLLKSIFNVIPNLNDYRVVYKGEISMETDNDLVICESIYTRFNINRPEDFGGHSMSVSDIIVLHGDYYFCDSFGFVKL